MFNLKNSPWAININSYLLLLLSFFLTTSIYVTDIIIFLLFLSWLIGGDIKTKCEKIYKNPITYSALCFLTYFLISYFWSESEIFNVTTKKQLLLLLLPVLYTLDFKDNYVENCKYGFILGLIANILLSIITLFFPNNSLFKTGHYDESIFIHGFLDHFDYSIFLCFSLFLLVSLLNSKNFWKYFILIIIIFITLLNSYGRAGVISCFIFLPIIIIFFKKSKLNYYLLLTILSFGVCSYYIFYPLKIRINETMNNIVSLYMPKSLEEKIEDDASYLAEKNDTLSKEYFRNEIQNNPEWLQEIQNKSPEYETSIGKRYLYVKNSLSLTSGNLVFGSGANQFQKLYTQNFQHDHRINHPHNNFIFVLIELGVVGLVLMLYIFYSQIKLFFSKKDSNFLKLIFPLYFLWIMLFDNYFLNHNSLVFFCFFSFLIYNKNMKSN